MDKLIKKTNLALVVGSSSWREQFVSAVTVSAGRLQCCQLQGLDLSAYLENMKIYLGI